MSKDEVNIIVLKWFVIGAVFSYCCVFLYNLVHAIKLKREGDYDWTGPAFSAIVMAAIVVICFLLYSYWQLPDHPLPR